MKIRTSKEKSKRKIYKTIDEYLQKFAKRDCDFVKYRRSMTAN